MKQIRVLIADNQALAIAGLRQILSLTGTYEVIAETPDGAELDELLEAQSPDILVLDHVNLNNFSMTSCLSLIKKRPFLKVLIISSENKAENILSLLEAQVPGFITKNCSRQEILHAFQAVEKGQKFYCNRVLEVLMEKKFNQADPPPELPLTMRERQIIEYISQGMPTREMASQLNLSPHTVNTYRKNLLKKMNVRSPVELVVKAFQTKLLQIPG